MKVIKADGTPIEDILSSGLRKIDRDMIANLEENGIEFTFISNKGYANRSFIAGYRVLIPPYYPRISLASLSGEVMAMRLCGVACEDFYPEFEQSGENIVMSVSAF